MAVSTLLNNKAAFPDSTLVDPGNSIPNALILTQSLPSGTIGGDEQTTRIAYVNDDPEAEYVAEGNEIPSKDPRITELLVYTRNVGLITVASNESYKNNGVPEMLGTSLARAITDKADKAFLSDPAPASGQHGFTGLINTPGIIDAGNITDSLDPIIDAIATIGTNRGTPSTIIAGYDSWAYMLKLKDKNGKSLIAPDVANSPTPSLYGIPVVLTSALTANSVLIIDRTQIVSALGSVSTAVSSERYFEKNSVGIRVMFRFGFGVVRPNRIAKLTVGATATK